ncbi:hypothetical protein OHT61_11085 [Streptomyces sp. NBC_00178]|uniref:hypothetical protein n=1 Tax=Streptomyces sp. NBC_00178 TaxID=2975672 RepID=UPI002E286363|nr:hypothetical protein [Streptomyces sp. NBC_00178]
MAEPLAEAVDSAAAACGVHASHTGDGRVGGRDGGVDIAEGEVGFGEAREVDGVCAGELVPVVRLTLRAVGPGGVLEVPEGLARVAQVERGTAEQLVGRPQVEPVHARRIVGDGARVGVDVEGGVRRPGGGAGVAGTGMGPAGAGVEHGGHPCGTDLRCRGQGRFHEVGRTAWIARRVLLDRPEGQRVRGDDRIVRAGGRPQSGGEVAFGHGDPAAVVSRPGGGAGRLGGGAEQAASDPLAVRGVADGACDEGEFGSDDVVDRARPHLVVEAA